MSNFELLGRTWKNFRMNDIFIFHKGKRLIKEDMNIGNTYFIGAIDDNNGIRQKIDSSPTHYGNCITINYNGSVGEAFYQDKPFLASDDVNILYPNNWELNRNIGLFLCTVIRANKYRFSYGRKWKVEKMRETLIALPFDKNGNPDWVFMESYIKKPYEKAELKVTTKNKSPKKLSSITSWKKFNLLSIFDNCIRGQRLKSEDREPGNIRYFSASEIDNGMTDRISNPLFVEKDSLIYTTFGDCFFIEGEFTASDEINIFKHRKLNKYNGLFIATIVNQDKYRYQFGRKAFLNKFENNTILLPVDRYGNPDWAYIESYIKSLPHGDNI